MVPLMQGFFIISCEIPVFPADNVPTSAGEKTACPSRPGKISMCCIILFMIFMKSCGYNLPPCLCVTSEYSPCA